jgi:hypothetical protein
VIKSKSTQVLRHRPQIEYNAKRMPSYCDRVCYKSLPGLIGRLAVTHYASCTDFKVCACVRACVSHVCVYVCVCVHSGRNLSK